jgi:hypothetical protein
MSPAIEVGLDSDLERARRAFPQARRALMYTAMDLANKTEEHTRNGRGGGQIITVP